MNDETYTLDGEEIDIEEFIYLNEFAQSEIDEIKDMEPGDTIPYGGGAAAMFLLERIN